MTISCALPQSLSSVAPATAPMRANASRRSHIELDEASDLDDDDPQELRMQYRSLHSVLPGLVVGGGCCGTDHRHVDGVCRNIAA
jgi:methionine synthase I (cobalamin-dependent)